MTPTLETLTELAQGMLPGLLGMTVDAVEPGSARLSMAVRPDLFAANGFLHAGSVVSLADTAAGYGCMASLPAGATSFTTLEMKSNFTGTARSGHVDCEATAVHLGRTTQVWDVTARSREQEKTIAHFRCTQLVLYPEAADTLGATS